MGSTKGLAGADPWSIATVTLTAAVGIAALAVGFQGWAWRKTTLFERLVFIIAGFALVYPGTVADVVGFGGVLIGLVSQYWRARAPQAPA